MFSGHETAQLGRLRQSYRRNEKEQAVLTKAQNRGVRTRMGMVISQDSQSLFEHPGIPHVAIADAIQPATAAKGHPIGFWFFFWGEFAERCSYYGMRAILALYMTERLGVSKADAGTFMSLFIAACYFFPLVGGFIADRFFGKYWTIVGFSIPYVVGQIIVGIENQYVVFGSLALLAMGSGVIKPNISTLMGMTYDQQRPGQEQLRSNAFSWFYLAINIGAFLSQLAVPYLRTAYSYQIAFLFPAALMALALAVFAMGKRFYGKEHIERKVTDSGNGHRPQKTLTGLPIQYRLMTAEAAAEDRALKRATLIRIGSLFLLVMFFWAIFDQSASTWIFFADTYMDLHVFGMTLTADQIQSVNAFFIMTLLPLSVVFFNAMAKRGIKIRPTDKMVAGFLMTALSMVIMSSAGFLAGAKHDAVKLTVPEGELILPMSETKLAEVKKAADGSPVTLDSGVKVLAKDFDYDKEKKKLNFSNGALVLKDGGKAEVRDGHLIASSLDSNSLEAGGVLESLLKSGDALAKVKSDAATATLEVVDWVRPAERVTVLWQILAFFVITIGEILISVTGLELAFVAAPPTMKSFVTACWLFTVGLANFVINAPITRLYPTMEPGIYFAILAGALAVVTVVFIPVSTKFNRGMAAAAAAEVGRPKEGDSEAV
jgi:dipeptide/tripeptide permease